MPGAVKATCVALVPDGLTTATGDWPVAEDIARMMYKRATTKANGGAADFDGTVADLVQRYMAFAVTYYIDPTTQKPSREVDNVKYAGDVLIDECPLCRVDDFGPQRFLSLRTKLVDTVDEQAAADTPSVRRVLKAGETFNPLTMTRTYCRNYINSQMSRIKRIFAWGVTSQLVSPSIDHGLRAVPVLKQTRTLARETERVRPVTRAQLKATLPYLTETVADLVQVMLLTGMRPGEAAIMRPCDITMSGDTWTYRPFQHKCKHWGIDRVVPLCGEAQRIIGRRMPKNTQEYIFSPNDARREYNPKAVLRPLTHYGQAAIGKAVRSAVKRANREGLAIEAWHPNQIRHLVATEVRETEGLDVARSLLGHKSLGTTDIYAEVNESQARRAVNRRLALVAG